MSKRLPHEEQVISDAAVQDFRVRNYRDNNSRDKYKKRVIVETDNCVETDDDEIINDIFQVAVSIEGAGDYQNVMIYWEDNGYNNYHDYGLYGAYSTAYYRMKYGDGKLIMSRSFQSDKSDRRNDAKTEIMQEHLAVYDGTAAKINEDGNSPLICESNGIYKPPFSERAAV